MNVWLDNNWNGCKRGFWDFTLVDFHIIGVNDMWEIVLNLFNFELHIFKD